MERRKVIKGIALSLGSLVTMPAWASGWSISNFETLTPLNNDALLAELCETIIPKTQTLGAKDLGIHQFIQKVVTDCFDKKARDNFAQSLSQIAPISIKAFGKPFVEGNTAQRINVLENLSKSEDKNLQNFYQILRGLTIQGYTSSEYYMTNFTDYEMAPARYLGCVPVKK